MLPDSQIAKDYKLSETKMKYIQFGIAPYFRDLPKDDLKKIPYSNLMKLKHNKPKNHMMATLNIGQKNISVLRYCTMEL